jgi:hypothetical protein
MWIKRLLRSTLKISASHFSQRRKGNSMNMNPKSAIIPFVGIIRKEYELRQQCHFVLLVGVLRQSKER